MTLDELAGRCKGEVHVTINEHTVNYSTVEEELDDRDDWFKPVTPELRARMISEGKIVVLQFYPHTPIGFYVTFGTSVEECLAQVEDGMFKS